jgi:hypothetical protein
LGQRGNPSFTKDGEREFYIRIILTYLLVFTWNIYALQLLDMARQFATQPPKLSVYELGFPAPYVVQVTINRESHMNAIPVAGHWEGERLWQWFDEEPSLRVAIVTGKGKRAFCCGADLKEQAQRNQSSEKPEAFLFPTGGFMGLSRRVGKKPVIAAVNGFALGGGFEVALNWYVGRVHKSQACHVHCFPFCISQDPN